MTQEEHEEEGEKRRQRSVRGRTRKCCRGGERTHALTMVWLHARYTLGMISPASPYMIPLMPMHTPPATWAPMSAFICRRATLVSE